MNSFLKTAVFFFFMALATSFAGTLQVIHTEWNNLDDPYFTYSGYNNPCDAIGVMNICTSGFSSFTQTGGNTGSITYNSDGSLATGATIWQQSEKAYGDGRFIQTTSGNVGVGTYSNTREVAYASTASSIVGFFDDAMNLVLRISRTIFNSVRKYETVGTVGWDYTDPADNKIYRNETLRSSGYYYGETVTEDLLNGRFFNANYNTFGGDYDPTVDSYSTEDHWKAYVSVMMTEPPLAPAMALSDTFSSEFSFAADSAPTPEPGTIAFIALGLAGLMARKLRKK